MSAATTRTGPGEAPGLDVPPGQLGHFALELYPKRHEQGVPTGGVRQVRPGPAPNVEQRERARWRDQTVEGVVDERLHHAGRACRHDAVVLLHAIRVPMGEPGWEVQEQFVVHRGDFPEHRPEGGGRLERQEPRQDPPQPVSLGGACQDPQVASDHQPLHEGLAVLLPPDESAPQLVDRRGPPAQDLDEARAEGGCQEAEFVEGPDQQRVRECECDLVKPGAPGELSERHETPLSSSRLPHSTQYRRRHLVIRSPPSSLSRPIYRRPRHQGRSYGSAREPRRDRWEEKRRSKANDDRRRVPGRSLEVQPVDEEKDPRPRCSGGAAPPTRPSGMRRRDGGERDPVGMELQ